MEAELRFLKTHLQSLTISFAPSKLCGNCSYSCLVQQLVRIHFQCNNFSAQQIVW